MECYSFNGNKPFNTCGKYDHGVDSVQSLLPEYFVPGPRDVICQRGKECYNHVGNKRFRDFITQHLEQYVNAKSRHKKAIIVSKIIAGVRENSDTSAGFIRKDLLTRRWYQVREKEAREKVGQAFRDAVKARRASSQRNRNCFNMSINCKQHKNRQQVTERKIHDIITMRDVGSEINQSSTHLQKAESVIQSDSSLPPTNFSVPPLSVISSSIRTLDDTGNRNSNGCTHGNYHMLSSDSEFKTAEFCQSELLNRDNTVNSLQEYTQYAGEDKMMCSATMETHVESQDSLNTKISLLPSVQIGQSIKYPFYKNEALSNHLSSTLNDSIDWIDLLGALKTRNACASSHSSRLDGKNEDEMKGASDASIGQHQNVTCYYNNEATGTTKEIYSKPLDSSDNNSMAQLLLALEPRPISESRR